MTLEAYRSGHNEAVLKTVWEKSHRGSNPFASATKTMLPDHIENTPNIAPTRPNFNDFDSFERIINKERRDLRMVENGYVGKLKNMNTVLRHPYNAFSTFNT